MLLLTFVQHICVLYCIKTIWSLIEIEFEALSATILVYHQLDM